MRYTLPSPIRGLDTTTSISEMQEGYAITLDNFFCDNSCLTFRKGYMEFAKLNTKGTIKTIISIPGFSDLLAITDKGEIFNVTKNKLLSFGHSGNGYWNYAYYKNRVYLVNSVDDVLIYDGKNIKKAAFTGVDKLNFASVCVINNQLIFSLPGDLAFYYAPVGNVSGELNRFDLSHIARLGGEVITATSWGGDTSNGYNQNAAFVTSQGEIIVYNNPVFSDANKINIVGVFTSPKPIGRNPVIKTGSDFILITVAGYIPMSTITSGGVDSSKIKQYVIDAAKDYKDQPGWAGHVVASENFIIINVPTGAGFNQHVMNLTTLAWSRFVNLPAMCFCVYDDKLLFGSFNGTIYIYSGTTDNGAAITGVVKNVYSKLGSNNLKRLLLFNPHISSDGEYNINYSISKDYSESIHQFSNTTTSGGFNWVTFGDPDTSGCFWDDGEFTGGINTVNRWHSISGICNTASLLLNISTLGVNIKVYETIFEIEESIGSL